MSREVCKWKPKGETSQRDTTMNENLEDANETMWWFIVSNKMFTVIFPNALLPGTCCIWSQLYTETLQSSKKLQHCVAIVISVLCSLIERLCDWPIQRKSRFFCFNKEIFTHNPLIWYPYINAGVVNNPQRTALLWRPQKIVRQWTSCLNETKYIVVCIWFLEQDGHLPAGRSS